MTTLLNPYLSFRDDAREALEFYRSVFGGELQLMTFDNMPGADPAEHAKVMHGQLTTRAGVLMAADTPTGMEVASGGPPICLSGDDADVLRGWWDALSGSGTVTYPLQPAPWGDHYGTCTDRFGTAWMFNVAGAPPT